MNEYESINFVHAYKFPKQNASNAITHDAKFSPVTYLAHELMMRNNVKIV